MSEIVETNIRQSRLREKAFEIIVQFVGFVRRPDPAGEDKPAILPPRAGSKPFFKLADFVHS